MATIIVTLSRPGALEEPGVRIAIDILSHQGIVMPVTDDPLTVEIVLAPGTNACFVCSGLHTIPGIRRAVEKTEPAKTDEPLAPIMSVPADHGEP